VTRERLSSLDGRRGVAALFVVVNLFASVFEQPFLQHGSHAGFHRTGLG